MLFFVVFPVIRITVFAGIAVLRIAWENFHNTIDLNKLAIELIKKEQCNPLLSLHDRQLWGFSPSSGFRFSCANPLYNYFRIIEPNTILTDYF